MTAARIVLASASPRRAELLEQIGIAYEVQAADIDETPRAGESAETLARRLAEAKAEAVARNRAEAVVIGSDTVVALGARVFGKPRDREDATGMLSQLSGRTHRVCSGVAVVRAGRCASRVCVSRVTLTTIDDKAIDAYWASGEPCGKAGAYAIQGRGAVFVKHLAGSYSGVMGLPLFETSLLLQSAGVDVVSGRPF